MYLDANNMCGWAMSQKLPINGFEWVEELSEFDEHFIKNYNENSDNGYILEIDVEYPTNLFNLHKDLPFFTERKKIEKCKKLASNMHDKENSVVHIRALTQALNHAFILEKVHKVIQYNQEEWLKPYIYMNTKLRTEGKNDFEKDFFKLMNKTFFWKNNGKCKKE